MTEKRKQLIALILIAVIVLGSLGSYVVMHYVNGQADPDQAEAVYQSTKNAHVLEDADPYLTQVDFASLQKVNSDIYAWIKVPGTDVDYPVLQSTTEDDDYYLHTTMDKKHGLPGSIYTEKYNAQDFTDPVTIIYGHNMKNGTMFTSLHRYEEQSFFDEHPYIYIYLPHAVYKYAIFSAVTFDDRYILGNYNFLDPNDFNSYISEISDSALGFVRDDLSVMPGNQVITLSTCLSNAPDKRYLVNAVLIETYQ